MKKVLSLVLIFTVLIGMLPVLSFAANVSDWAKAEIEEAKEKNLIPKEMLADDFTESITRAEFAAIAVQLYETSIGETVSYGDCPFTDMDQYDIAIKKAYSLGITTGMSETIFEPNALISREQLATMLNRAVKKYMFADWNLKDDVRFPLNYSGAVEFADDASVSDYAEEAVYFMSKHGIVRGVDEASFAPQATATKQEAILLALRILNTKETWDAIASKGKPAAYAQQYIDYVVANTEAFERGIALYDFNEDGLPELFAISVDENGWIASRHDPINHGADLKESFVLASTDGDLVRPATFYENPAHFSGMHRDKNTGAKTYIVYDKEKDYCRTYSYAEEGCKINDYNIDYATDLDKVMRNYTYIEERICFSFLPHGAHTAETLAEEVPDLIARYERGQLAPRYISVEESIRKDKWLIHSVDLESREMVLIPAATMTYLDYTAAMEAGGWYVLNGEEFLIQTGEVYAPEGYAALYTLPDMGYRFEIPDRNEEVLIEGYFENTPVKVKMSETMQMQQFYYVYDLDGVFTGEWGRYQCTPTEYFENYAKCCSQAGHRTTYSIFGYENGILEAFGQQAKIYGEPEGCCGSLWAAPWVLG